MNSWLSKHQGQLIGIACFKCYLFEELYAKCLIDLIDDESK